MSVASAMGVAFEPGGVSKVYVDIAKAGERLLRGFISDSFGVRVGCLG